jgi:thiamine-phosphate pyrophosphorylase
MNERPRRDLAGRRGLYLVLTNPGVPHEELARAAAERRVPILQLREKDLPDRDVLALAVSLRRVTAETGTLLIVNDRPDIAAAADADGVHLGQDDLDPASARKLLGPDKVIGISTNTVEEVPAAAAAGADYIALGPVFPTPTKPDTRRSIGLDGLSERARLAPGTPKVAIGGLNATNAAAALEAGADFVAVISAVCGAEDPAAAIDSLQRAMGILHS